jgi:hypothetical protein
VRVTASKIELLDFCQAWPRYTWSREPPGEAALTGSAVHSLIEQELGGGEAEFREGADVVKAAKLFETWKGWWPGYAGDRKFEPEVVLLYDVRTGAVRREKAGWVKGDRARGEWEIPAILDALCIEGDRAEVWDWKTGRKLGAASSNGQLMIGALAVHRFFGVSEVQVGLAYPGIRKMRGTDTADFNSLDLIEHEERLRWLVAKIPEAMPNPGKEWCFRCPARRGGCPIYAQL